MAKNENLRSVFDWIQIQFNTFDFSLEEIVEDILFLDTELFIIDKGSLKYYEYDSQINYGNIRIYYGDEENSKACHVRTSFRILSRYGFNSKGSF